MTEQSPRMRRVVLGGGDLGEFVWPGPGSHLKLLLPQPGDDELHLPTPGPDGLVQFDRSRLVMRTYTPRAWDPGLRELTIDVFVHGDGPAVTWATTARVGDQVAVSRPRARYDIDEGGAWLLLAGDETAVPAIGTILEARTTGVPTTVVIESDGDDRDLGLPADSGTVFVPRSDGPPGQALLAAITELLPGGDGRVWVAGEARGIRGIRRYLQQERGLPAATMVTRGYWRLGEADHPDHDYGDDADQVVTGSPTSAMRSATESTTRDGR